MKAPPFDYHAPDELDAALALLAEHGDEAKVLAGGQSLVPILALRLAHPAVVVDIGRIGELGSIEVNGRLRIGAGVTQRRLERHAAVGGWPLLARALPLIGHPQIRNRGTVCGSLAHADPAAELPAVMLALDATLHIAGPRGRRAVPAEAFFRSYLETAVEPDEILTAVEVSRPPAGRYGAAIQEISRRHGDFALAGAAATVRLDGDGRVADARIALFGVAATPIRARDAEAALIGTSPDGATLADVAPLAGDGLTPPSDVHATGAYRKHVTAVLVRRALTEAVDAANRGVL